MENIEKIKPTGLFTNYIYKAIPLAFDESMSYYETLCGLLNYLKDTVIPAVNNNADAVIELQNLYIQLKSYVDNYFDNLDVQEEINNKLDEMVESGELQEIIGAYLNSKAVFGFDNVESMKQATNLINNSYAKTLGYYNINDLGGALYKIRTKTENDVIDNKTIIQMNNTTLVAVLIINNTMNVEQFGAYGDNTNDDSDAIQTAINNCGNVIFTKTYKTTSQITINSSCNLLGNKNATINSTLSGKISVFKILHSYVNFKNLTINLTYNGGGSTGEHGNVISFATYKMDESMNLHDFIIENCNLTRTGNLSYNIGIFGDTHNVIIKNCYVYGECINLHWSGDFDERYPDTGKCTITFHPYNVSIDNCVLENNRGVFISSGYNVNIKNTRFINNTNPITIGIGDYGNTMANTLIKDFITRGINIENCEFKEYTNECLRVSAYGYREDDPLHNKNYITTSQVNVKNCTFADSTQNPNTAIVSSVLFYGLNIEDCYFKTTNRKNAIYVSPLFDSSIKNCKFEIAGTPISIFGGNNLIIENCKAIIKNGYNFLRTSQYTFSFTETTYQVNNLTVKNNDVNTEDNAQATLILLDYTHKVLIDSNDLLRCNIGVNINTNNSDVLIYNNKFSDSSETLIGTHFNIISNNSNITIAKNNKFNGSRGIQVKTNTSRAIISDNYMLDNPFANALLCVVDSRNDKNVYLIGNLVDSNASMIYGTNYKYVDYTENA